MTSLPRVFDIQTYFPTYHIHGAHIHLHIRPTRTFRSIHVLIQKNQLILFYVWVIAFDLPKKEGTNLQFLQRAHVEDKSLRFAETESFGTFYRRGVFLLLSVCFVGERERQVT